MTKSLLLRRGTSAEHSLFTGLKGEITFDTTKNTAVVHNGVAMGGFPVAKEDLSNVSDDRLTERGIAKNNLSNVSLNDIDSRGIARKDLTNITDELLTNRGIAKVDLSNFSDDAMAKIGKRGIIEIADPNEVLAATNKTKAITPHGLGTYMRVNGGGSSPMGYMHGFTIRKSDENSIVVGTGQAKSSDNTIDISLASPMGKILNAEWSEGMNAGAGFTNTLQPNTLYHIFVISNLNGQGDVGIDTSRTADNLMQKTSQFEYTKFRRIAGFWTTETSDIEETSIAYPGTYKTRWLRWNSYHYESINHNLNIPETDQRVRLMVKMRLTTNTWQKDDIMDIIYNNYSSADDKKDYGPMFEIKRNTLFLTSGSAGELFFHHSSGTGPAMLWGVNKYSDTAFMAMIDYPIKYDL